MRGFKWFIRLCSTIICISLVAGIFVFFRFPSLPGVINDGVPNRGELTQVLVPGRDRIDFNNPGAYAVYYEYISVFEEKDFSASDSAPTLACELISAASKEVIQPSPDIVRTNQYSLYNHERIGYQIMTIVVNDPGAYDFSCDYSGATDQAPVVLAIGPNFAWESINNFVKLGVSVFTGFAFFSLGYVGLLIWGLITQINRFRDKPNDVLRKGDL